MGFKTQTVKNQILIWRYPSMETITEKRFNPFEGLLTIEAIETKLAQILSLSGNFFQESSDPEEVKNLAEEAIKKIQQKN